MIVLSVKCQEKSLTLSCFVVSLDHGVYMHIVTGQEEPARLNYFFDLFQSSRKALIPLSVSGWAASFASTLKGMVAI